MLPMFSLGQESLALLPPLVPCPDSGADHFIGLIGREGSAKEAIMAMQEIVEHLELGPDSEEAADDDLWLVRQIARALRVYALGWWLSCLTGCQIPLKAVPAVPRLPRRKRSPAEQLRPLLAELQSVMSQEMRSATGTAGRMVLDSLGHFVKGITVWVDTDVSLGPDEKKLIAVCMVTFSVTSIL